MKYTVHIAPQADEHLRDITLYIAQELQAPAAALSTLDELEEAIDSLDIFPERIPLTREESWRQQGDNITSRKRLERSSCKEQQTEAFTLTPETLHTFCPTRRMLFSMR